MPMMPGHVTPVYLVLRPEMETVLLQKLVTPSSPEKMRIRAFPFQSGLTPELQYEGAHDSATETPRLHTASSRNWTREIFLRSHVCLLLFLGAHSSEENLL